MIVELQVGIRLAVELVTEAGPGSSWHRSETATLGPIFMVNRTGRGRGLGEEEGASIASGLVFNQRGFGPVGRLKRHGQTSRAQGQAGMVENALFVASPSDKGEGGKAPSVLEIIINVPSIKGGVKGATGGFVSQRRSTWLSKGKK